jgi:hypothetical protein
MAYRKNILGCIVGWTNQPCATKLNNSREIGIRYVKAQRHNLPYLTKKEAFMAYYEGSTWKSQTWNPWNNIKTKNTNVYDHNFIYSIPSVKCHKNSHKKFTRAHLSCMEIMFKLIPWQLLPFTFLNNPCLHVLVYFPPKLIAWEGE